MKEIGMYISGFCVGIIIGLHYAQSEYKPEQERLQTEINRLHKIIERDTL
jgi:NADH:ubiquinone oxidoreductase subunit F (NADH-binding)